MTFRLGRETAHAVSRSAGHCPERHQPMSSESGDLLSVTDCAHAVRARQTDRLSQ
jgi:hypothetical protein